MSQVTSPVILDSTGQDIVTQLATISAALAAGNIVTGNTDTTLSGVLQGANGKVAVKPVDASPTADSTNLVTSGGTKAALDVKANQSQLAYVETGTTASRAYSVGEYFCWNGLLYRAKTAIGNGDTFTVNTNCEQVTAGGLNNLIQVVYGSQATISVPNNTTTVIDSISLPSGTYLIMGSTSINISSNTNMSLAIVGSGGVGSLATSRGTADAGGGLLVCAVVTIEASTTFTLRLRHSAGDNVSTVGNKFSSIQLK